MEYTSPKPLPEIPHTAQMWHLNCVTKLEISFWIPGDRADLPAHLGWCCVTAETCLARESLRRFDKLWKEGENENKTRGKDRLKRSPWHSKQFLPLNKLPSSLSGNCISAQDSECQMWAAVMSNAISKLWTVPSIQLSTPNLFQRIASILNSSMSSLHFQQSLFPALQLLSVMWCGPLASNSRLENAAAHSVWLTQRCKYVWGTQCNHNAVHIYVIPIR